MADPYVPFGYMPPTLGGPPRRMRSLGEMGFAPPVFPAAEGGLMPQSPQEAADLTSQAGVGHAYMAIPQMGLPFALAGPMGAVGKLGMEAVRRAPQVAAGLGAMLGTGAVINSTEPTPAGAQRRPPPTDAVRALQLKLQEEGFYKGTIDGVMGDETKAANAAFEARERQRADERTRQQQLELQRAQTDTERERLRLQQQEQERLRAEGERAAEVQRLGSERLRQVGEPSMLEQYGPLAGYPLGFLAAVYGRSGLGSVMDRIASSRVKRADTLMNRAGRGPVPQRVGRVNQYWTEGGSPQAPFSFVPGARPYPFSANPQAAPANQLYQPGAFERWGPMAAIGGSGLAETGAGMALGHQARQELESAQTAVSAEPTEANIQRLLAARRNVAMTETLANFGRGTLVGTLPGELKSRLTHSTPRPNVSVAEGERGALDRLVGAPAAAGRRARPSQPRGPDGRFLPRP
jgi:peptidoglycan hydrolase-like protein with peptidoglycan-binding domain